MSKKDLIIAIARQTVVSKLLKLRNTGLNILVGLIDITENDIVELTEIINARIAELS